MYSVFTKLGDGDFLYVATRDNLEQAVQLADALNASWPRDYVVRDSQGNDIDFSAGRSMELERSQWNPSPGDCQ